MIVGLDTPTLSAASFGESTCKPSDTVRQCQPITCLDLPDDHFQDLD